MGRDEKMRLNESSATPSPLIFYASLVSPIGHLFTSKQLIVSSLHGIKRSARKTDKNRGTCGCERSFQARPERCQSNWGSLVYSNRFRCFFRFPSARVELFRGLKLVFFLFTFFTSLKLRHCSLSLPEKCLALRRAKTVRSAQEY